MYVEWQFFANIFSTGHSIIFFFDVVTWEAIIEYHLEKKWWPQKRKCSRCWRFFSKKFIQHEHKKAHYSLASIFIRKFVPSTNKDMIPDRIVNMVLQKNEIFFFRNYLTPLQGFRWMKKNFIFRDNYIDHPIYDHVLISAIYKFWTFKVW